MFGTIPPPIQFPLPPLETTPLDEIERGKVSLYPERSGTRVSLIIQTAVGDPKRFAEAEVRLITPSFPNGINCWVEQCQRVRSDCWELVLEPGSRFEEAALKRLLAAGIKEVAGCELRLDGMTIEFQS